MPNQGRAGEQGRARRAPSSSCCPRLMPWTCWWAGPRPPPPPSPPPANQRTDVGRQCKGPLREKRIVGQERKGHLPPLYNPPYTPPFHLLPFPSPLSPSHIRPGHTVMKYSSRESTLGPWAPAPPCSISSSRISLARWLLPLPGRPRRMTRMRFGREWRPGGLSSERASTTIAGGGAAGCCCCCCCCCWGVGACWCESGGKGVGKGGGPGPPGAAAAAEGARGPPSCMPAGLWCGGLSPPGAAILPAAPIRPSSIVPCWP